MAMFFCRIGFLLALLAAGIVPAAAQSPKVESIRVQLYKENTGTLSDDILTNNPGLWNVIIGENQANSFLVTVIVSGKPDSYEDGTVTVTVFNDETKRRVVQRRYRGFLFGKDGRTFKPLLVDDMTCNRVRIVARTRAGEKSETVTFRCGE